MRNSLPHRIIAVIMAWIMCVSPAMPFLLTVGTIMSLSLPRQAVAYTANDFVITVTPTGNSFTIPTTGTGYNYNVDCNNDGINEATAQTGNYTCTYANASAKTIVISGTFPRFYLNNGAEKAELTSIVQWGTGAWTSMTNAFYGANNLTITATDSPNLGGVTDMSQMFY